MRAIQLWNTLPEIMLIVEHPSRVLYQNRVGGVAARLEAMEGVLVPLDLGDAVAARIRNGPYAVGAQGITADVADIIDALLAPKIVATFLKVDRARLHESWDAWIYVTIDSPATTVEELYDGYFGPIYGFGATKGVLTWRNTPDHT